MSDLKQLKSHLEALNTSYNLKKDEIKNLTEQAKFNDTIVFNMFLADVVGEDSVIESKNHKECNVKNSKGNILCSIGVINEENSCLSSKVEDFKIQNQGWHGETYDLEKAVVIGAVASKILENKESMLEEINKGRETYAKEAESKERVLLDEFVPKINVVREDIKKIYYKQFLKDIMVGVVFDSYVYVPKRQDEGISVKNFKVTRFSPSGKTTYFEYSRFGIGFQNEEIMTEKLPLFFDEIYDFENGKFRKEYNLI
jgi:hypothetical protein